MKRSLSAEPPPDLVAYQLEPGRVLFMVSLPTIALGVLTGAEAEVAAMLLDGRESASIADARGTSVHTVSNQIASIYRKLDVRSRAELAARAYGLTSSTGSRPSRRR